MADKLVEISLSFLNGSLDRMPAFVNFNPDPVKHVKNHHRERRASVLRRTARLAGNFLEIRTYFLYFQMKKDSKS